MKAKERLRYYRQFQKNNKRKWKKWMEDEDQKIMAPKKLPGHQTQRITRKISAGDPAAAIYSLIGSAKTQWPRS